MLYFACLYGLIVVHCGLARFKNQALNRHQRVLAMDITAFLSLLHSFDIHECRGDYQMLVFERVRSYADLVQRPISDLTLSELMSIIDSSTCEFHVTYKEAIRLSGCA